MNLRKIFGCVAAMLTLAVAVMAPAAAAAEPSGPLGRKERKEAMKILTADYRPWLKASLQGRVQTDMLPVSPGLRISMEKGKSLIVSVRASILGEVARMEMDKESILIVNKYRKRYCRLWPERCGEMLDHAQSLLLGRVVVVGSGELSGSNVGKTQFYAVADPEGPSSDVADPGDCAKEWIIAPQSLWDSIDYEYLVNSDGRIMEFTISAVKALVDKLMGVETAPDAERLTVPVAKADIEWERSGETVSTLSVNAGRREYRATLTMDPPEYGARMTAPIELTDKYKESPLREVIKF